MTLQYGETISNFAFRLNLRQYILARLHHLRHLDLSRNHLRGTLSSALGSMRRLRVLQLRANAIAGKLPGELGRAVQVDPMKPKLRPPGTKRLKLEYDGLPSDFAFKFNLRRYSWARLPPSNSWTCRITA